VLKRNTAMSAFHPKLTYALMSAFDPLRLAEQRQSQICDDKSDRDQDCRQNQRNVGMIL
jgi:hypothetical protein